MVQVYNFLASWQLFPEKCNYELGIIPKSGNYKIESILNGEQLSISNNWVSVTNDAFHTEYKSIPDSNIYPYPNQEFADSIQSTIINTGAFVINFFRNNENRLEVLHEILANGFLKVTQKGLNEHHEPYTNVEVYHKQMSVLPYASSSSSVAIRPTNEGVMKHKALSAMEEQTNMQLNQIKQQIELLAKQAQEIQKRKELSLMIYDASMKFKPQIGHVYHLYEQRDGQYHLSMIAPSEWGGTSPFNQFIASVKLLADHTWMEEN